MSVSGTQARTFSFNVYLTRDPELPGQWVGHCLDVDVVSQGESLKRAYEMTREAVEILVLEDLNAGLEPTERSAPREEWEKAFGVVQSANPKLYTLSELFERESSLHFALAPLVLNFVRAVPALQESEVHPRAQAA